LAEAVVKETQAAVDQALAILNKNKKEYLQALLLQKQRAAGDLEYLFARDLFKAQEAVVRKTLSKLEQARIGLDLAYTKRLEIKLQEHEQAICESIFRQSAADVDIARAQYEKAMGYAKAMAIKFNETRIFSPCSGIIITRNIEPGEVSNAGSPLLIIMDFRALYFKGYLPGDDADKISLQHPVRLYFEAFPHRYFKGSILRITPQPELAAAKANSSHRQIHNYCGVEIRVENPFHIVKPGLLGQAIVKYDAHASWHTPDALR
jgi:HlyD family secretion protein